MEADLLRISEPSDTTCFLPARPGERITLAEVEQAIEGGLPHFPAQLVKAIPALERFAEHRRQWEQDMGETTLATTRPASNRPDDGEHDAPAQEAPAQSDEAAPRQ